MATSKAQKRITRRKHQAKRLAVIAPTKRVTVRRSSRLEAGPTPQTVAKLKPDTLVMLRALKVNGEPFLDANLVEAGEEVLRAWMLITSAVDCRSPSPGAGIDRASTERLQRVWRRWCGVSHGQLPPDELYRRCLVRPSVVVDWIKHSDSCDRDPKGAAGVLKRALEWWRLAARDVAKSGKGET
jgi:hypothetical protein